MMTSDTHADLDEAQLGRAFRYGTLFGLPTTFLIVTAISLAAGVPVGTAFLVAVWPALVAGPFLGTVIAIGAVSRHDQAVAPAAPTHHTVPSAHRHAA